VALSGSGVFGPSGGTLVLGRNRLIIPSGALAEPTLITATVPDDTIAAIQFQPEGLRFLKPAGLVLDVAGCGIPGSESAPDIVYMNDSGEILERIDAIFSSFWHTVAAPIEHFSQYAVAV